MAKQGLTSDKTKPEHGKGESGIPRLIKEEIQGALREIVGAIIGKAKEGSYLHAKFLVEIAGLDREESAEIPMDEEAIVKKLIKSLQGELPEADDVESEDCGQ